jgi:hypothetical protein
VRGAYCVKQKTAGAMCFRCSLNCYLSFVLCACVVLVGSARVVVSHPEASGCEEVGSDVLSHLVTKAVPSALASLTTGFEKRPGGPSPLQPPTPSPSPRLWAGQLPAEIDSLAQFNAGMLACIPLPRLRTNRWKPSTISTGELQTLLPFHFPPIELVVFQRSYRVSPSRVSS